MTFSSVRFHPTSSEVIRSSVIEDDKKENVGREKKNKVYIFKFDNELKNM